MTFCEDCEATFSYLPTTSVIYAEEQNTGNSDRQSLIFIEDDNIQHSSAMMFASYHSLISYLNTSCRNLEPIIHLPLWLPRHQLSSSQKKPGLQTNSLSSKYSSLMSNSSLGSFMLSGWQVSQYWAMPETSDQAHPLNSDRWVNSRNVNLSVSANQYQIKTFRRGKKEQRSSLFVVYQSELIGRIFAFSVTLRVYSNEQ